MASPADIHPAALYTTKEAASLLRIGRRTLQSYVAQGLIEHVQYTPRCVRFLGAALIDFIQRHTCKRRE